jgi:hypothetical protein
MSLRRAKGLSLKKQTKRSKIQDDNSDFGLRTESDVDIEERSDNFESHESFNASTPGYRKKLGDKLRFRDTISELYDQGDKDAVYQSSMKKGGAVHEFNESLRAGKLGNMMKDTLTGKGYQPYPQPKMAAAFSGIQATELGQKGEEPFEFSAFQPKNLPKDNLHPALLTQSFGLKPKKMNMCKRHKNSPVEFYCDLSGDFFCKLCAKQHRGHDDHSIHETAAEVQESLTGLKHLYLTKRSHVMNRLAGHQRKLEEYFELFYSVLDAQRAKVLKEEYFLRDMMDNYEKTMKKLLHRAHKYDLTEFFLEKDTIMGQINKLKNDVNRFALYCPSYSVDWHDEGPETARDRIKNDLKTKIEKYLVEIDNSFALRNFKYITKELGNSKLADVYQMLGPFDYSQHKEDRDEDHHLGSQNDSSDDDDKRFFQAEFS